MTDARRGGGVVVTGASSGIGAAVVAELAWRGYRVFGTVRRDADRASLEAVGAIPIVMDVTDGEAVARARGEVERSLAGASLVGLVNNAGIGTAGPLSLLPLDELRRVLEVNLVGVLAVTQAFLPLLTAARSPPPAAAHRGGRTADSHPSHAPDPRPDPRLADRPRTASYGRAIRAFYSLIPNYSTAVRRQASHLMRITVAMVPPSAGRLVRGV